MSKRDWKFGDIAKIGGYPITVMVLRRGTDEGITTDEGTDADASDFVVLTLAKDAGDAGPLRDWVNDYWPVHETASAHADDLEAVE
jgi:hypothetical protein